MARQRTLIIIATLGLASAIFGITANVATSTLPELLPATWKPYLPWVAWPLALISAFVLVALPVRQYLDEHAPGAETITLEQRNRRHMLEKVRRIWITDLLDRSLYRETLISLDLLEQPGLVQRPMDLLVQRPDRDPRPLSPGTTIAQVYDELGHELLILGAPGAGKTTLLLDLTRELLGRAEQDATHPIPVVFPLASWAEQHGALADWLTHELNKRYDVPPAVATAWIASDAVLPLLDGLDEVASAQRTACVAAINAFRTVHGLLPIVVCSRVGEYAELREWLRLGGAIVVQPLTRPQVTTYLRQIGRPLAGLRAALREDATLWELLETPLLLSIMTLAYQGLSAVAVRTSGTLEERRTRLFAAYVVRMFERRRKDTPYTREQTFHHLACLARRMAQHSQTVFYIEHLQPDWLPNSQQWIPTIGVAVGIGLVVGLSIMIGFVEIVGSNVGWTFVLIGGLCFGLAGGMVFGLLLAGRDADTRRITSVETLRWTWSAKLLRRGLLSGAFFGSLSGLVSGQNGDVISIVIGILFGVVIGVLFSILVFGLVGNEIDTKVVPNQGIYRSVHNALRYGAVFGTGGGLTLGLIFGLITGWVGDLKTGIVNGVVVGLGVGLVFGLIGGLQYGGRACLQHLVLRVLLWRNGSAPWNYARFLDYAAERILLRKVGGGYIFVHRLLMDYFAALEPPPAPSASQRADAPPSE